MSEKLYEKPDKKIAFEKRLLPLNFSNRSGEKQIPTYIVIHEVSLGLGESSEYYNMDRYSRKIFLDGFNGSFVGYHFLVGDDKIYQFIPEEESANHTGTVQGNKCSIGIERIICEGINQEHALFNQAKLIATLMIKYDIPISNVVTHKWMQDIYEPTVKNYKVVMDVQDVSNDISKDTYEEELDLLMEIYGNLYESYPELFGPNNKDKYSKGLIQEYNKWLNNYKRTLRFFEKMDKKQKKCMLGLVVELRFKLNRLLCSKDKLCLNNQAIEVDGMTIKEELETKQCPSRLLANQRGGLKRFYNQIHHCLVNGILYDEILDDNRYVEPTKEEKEEKNRTLEELVSLPKVEEILKSTSIEETKFNKIVSLSLMDYTKETYDDVLSFVEIIKLVQNGYVVPTKEEWEKFVEMNKVLAPNNISLLETNPKEKVKKIGSIK